MFMPVSRPHAMKAGMIGRNTVDIFLKKIFIGV